MMKPSTPSVVRKAKSSSISAISVSLKIVVLVQTRNPLSLAALMPSIAASNTPSRSTAMSWVFRMPSRWTLKKNVRLGREFVELLADEHAVGAEDDDLLALLDLLRPARPIPG